MIKILLIFVFISSSGLGADSNLSKFIIAERLENQIHFKIKYSLGTHEGVAKKIQSELQFDFLSPNKSKGFLAVPLSALATGSEGRDCHMREALGINYELSDYPKEHVCDDKNELLTSGKNAVVYPEIRFELKSLKINSWPIKDSTDAEIEGEWKIHGQVQPANIKVKMSQDKGVYRIQGSYIFNLTDFKVEVKSAKILIATIKTSNEVLADFDIFYLKESP